jgi:hypothetical protein
MQYKYKFNLPQEHLLRNFTVITTHEPHRRANARTIFPKNIGMIPGHDLLMKTTLTPDLINDHPRSDNTRMILVIDLPQEHCRDPYN